MCLAVENYKSVVGVALIQQNNTVSIVPGVIIFSMTCVEIAQEVSKANFFYLTVMS